MRFSLLHELGHYILEHDLDTIALIETNTTIETFMKWLQQMSDFFAKSIAENCTKIA